MAKAKQAGSDNTTKTSSDKQPFFNASGAIDAYDEAVNWFRPYFEPIEEFERIARNKPSSRISPELPKITDGTMAAIVQEQPKRIIQQLATGLVECNDYTEYAKIADIVHREVLIPMSNRMGTKLQKDWNMLSKAMTWGRSTSYSFLTTTNGKVHVDFVIPYVKDVYSEKGKVYAPDSNIGHLVSWYQKRDLKSILKREEWLEANHEGYKSDWILKELGDFIDAGASAKSAEEQTPAEREKGGDTGGYKMVHAFQEGKGAEFYSFAPRSGNIAGKPLRTKINKDPRGKMPLDFEYCNIDLSNPLGRGQIELSGGVQNLIDQQMQMFQFLTTLLMAPPLQTWGTVNKASLKFRPNAVWDMGSNANNRVEPYEVSNHAIQQFAGNYGLLKSQIYNLNSSQDHSISADDAPQQSKTQAGVKAAESKLGVSDNYLRKQHETWSQDQAETAINLYFAEMTTNEKIQLKGEDLKELRKDPLIAKHIDDDGVLTVPHKQINDVVMKFHVDASSSEIKEDADNAEKLIEALKLVQTSQNPEVQKAEVKITKLILDEIGAEGTDDLFPSEVDEEGNPVEEPGGADPQAMMQQIMPAVQEMVATMLKEQEKPKEDPTLALIKALGLKFDQLPEAARQIVLEHTGLNTGDPTPVDEKHDMEVFNHLNSADSTMEGQDQARQQAEMQNQQGVTPSTGDSGNNPSLSSMPENDTPSGEEQELIETLLQHDFSEDDVEQAVVMFRSGKPLEEIIPTLGAKYAN